MTIAPQAPAAPADDETVFTTRQAALMLGVTLRCAQMMVDDGRLAIEGRTAGGHRRIKMSSVIARVRAGGIKEFGPNDRLVKLIDVAKQMDVGREAAMRAVDMSKVPVYRTCPHEYGRCFVREADVPRIIAVRDDYVRSLTKPRKSDGAAETPAEHAERSEHAAEVAA